MNSKQVEAALTEACEKAKEKGWTIMDMIYLNLEAKKCCPIGALFVADHDDIDGRDPGITYTMTKLGLNNGDIFEIYTGVDNTAPRIRNKALYRVGRRLARRFIKDAH